jgi:Flp pilus assembly protein TadD
VRLARLALEDAELRPAALERLRRLLEGLAFDEGEYLAASLELLAGKAVLAESRLLKLTALEPPRAQPWRLLVQMLTARGDLEGALEMAGRYAARFPADPHPRYLQADLLARLGRAPQALTVLQGLEDRVEPLYLLARLAGRQGQVTRQRELLERLLGLDPWPYRAERLLAALCDRLGETERAIELYKRYLRSIEAAVYERQEYVEASARFRALTQP